MLSEINVREFREWGVFFSLEPTEVERNDIHFARIIQTLFNINRDPKKHPKGFPLADFILPFGDAPERVQPTQTWQDQKEVAKMYVAMFNALQAADDEEKVAQSQSE